MKSEKPKKKRLAKSEKKAAAPSPLVKYYNRPDLFVSEIIRAKEIEPEQKNFMQLVASNRRTAAKSGNGVGKTATVSWLILWWMFTRPDAKVVCTAPSRSQLMDGLWSEIAKWMSGNILSEVFEWTKTRISARGAEDRWWASPRTANKKENIAGIHERFLLQIVDEASGIAPQIEEALEGNLSGDENKLVIIGNPTRTSGMFYNAFHADRDLYSVITFNAEKSKRVSKEQIERWARYGKESDFYKVHVLGEFPSGDPDSLIALWLAEGAIGREPVNEGDYVIGVDPARFGNDDSVICEMSGDRVLPFTAFNGFDTQRLSGEVLRKVRAARKEGYIGTIEIRVDDTGIGGGVTDALKQREKADGVRVVPLNFGGRATNNDFNNFGSQMWGNMREALSRISLPKDDFLIAQMTTRKYTIDPKGKICLERKEDMKKRGLPSPDRADALALCLAEIHRTGTSVLNSLSVEAGGREEDLIRDFRRQFDSVDRSSPIEFGE